MRPVFVYGTLKDGFPNAHINKGTRVPGEFLTKKRHPLYLVGQRHSPWLVHRENEGHHVRGQVFMVGDDVLEEMDALERVHEPDGYRKVSLRVVSEATGEEMLVSAYLKPWKQLESAVIQMGPLKEYELRHASLYQPRTS